MRASIRPFARVSFPAAAILIAFAAAALAQGAPAYFGVTFPESLQGARRGAVVDYETTGHPGLGYSAGYGHRDWKADVYVYDLRRPKISADLSSPDVTSHFDQVVRDVSTPGLYSNVVAEKRFSIADGGGALRFVCQSFSFTHPQVGPSRSALCLTSWRDKFVKIRLTAPGNGDATSAMRKFADDWTRILWPRA